MAVGLAGTVIPLLPGLPIIWAAAAGYGALEGFGAVGLLAMVAITVLLAGGVTGKFVLARRRASTTGAPTTTIGAGALLGFIGFFVVPVIGFVLGAVLGVLLAERRRLHDWSRAWVSARGVIAGFGIGVLLEIGAGLLMIGCWVAWVLIET